MERYLRVNLLGPGPRLMKKNLPGRGLTKVQKHCSRENFTFCNTGVRIFSIWCIYDFNVILMKKNSDFWRALARWLPNGDG